MKNLLKKLYTEADIDFLINESVKLTDIEFKQTFREYKASADYTYKLLESCGITAERYVFPADGKTTYQDFRTPLAWEASVGKLTVTKSEIPFDEPVVADYERHPFHLIKGSTATPEGGIRARLLTEEQVLNGADARGAIVVFPSDKFARSAAITPMLDAGAIGFVSTCIGRGMASETPDCIAWCNAATDDHSHWHVQAEDRAFLGFSVSPRTGDKLRDACAAGEVEVLAESDGKRYSGEIEAICGYVEGKSDKEIWLIAHLFEPFVTDNSLSVMMAIEIAKQIKKMGKPNFSVRLVFSAETYGLAAVWDALKSKVSGKVLGALDIDTPPAYTFDENYDLRFNPYCSPFFGNSLFRIASDIYSEVFPNYEKCANICTEFGDDLIIGDPTIGVPTIYFEEDECKHWHSSHWVPEALDTDRVRRSYSICALWGVMMAFLDKNSVKEYLPECVKIAQDKLNAFAKEDNSRARMEFFLSGERAQIMDFARAIALPEIEKSANELGISPDCEAEFKSKALEKVSSLIVSRATEGFPYDLIKIPYKKRRALPNGVLYGAFATIIAKLDGVKPLGEIILEAAWEHKLTVSDFSSSSNHFIPLSEQLIKDYIDAIYYLAEYGYLKIEER